MPEGVPIYDSSDVGGGKAVVHTWNEQALYLQVKIKIKIKDKR